LKGYNIYLHSKKNANTNKKHQRKNLEEKEKKCCVKGTAHSWSNNQSESKVNWIQQCV
jgi:hypothetical protein